MPHDRTHLIVLGLGGLTLDLATALAATGRLPNLARLLTENAAAIEAERPAVAPVNRASLLTAASPGRHGIFGFTAMEPGLYRPVPYGDDAICLPTLPQRLAAAGRTAVWIDSAVPEEAPADTAPPMAALARGIDASLAARQKALAQEAADDDWDLLFWNLPETTDIFRWHHAAVTRSEHPEHAAALNLLAAWDRALGAGLDRYAQVAGPKRLLAVADHGVAGLATEVDLNAWLSAEGLLATGLREDGSVRILPHQTAAFALDSGRICINTKEHFARGVFHEHVAEELAVRLRHALLDLTFEDTPVMEAVLLAADFADGPLPLNAPDLICVGAPGMALSARYDRPHIFGRFAATGCASPHDLLVCDSEASRPARMRDVGAAIAQALALPEVPERP